MQWDKVTASQTEEEWFEEYVRLALASAPPALPATQQKIGATIATWFECEPGTAFIRTEGGSRDDQTLAENIVRQQLAAVGIEQAQYTFDQDEDFRKTAHWNDIMAKAKRLTQAGQVHLLRNGAQDIVAQVQGDNGTYQSTISRQDPNSRSITQWECECPWDQYAWQRTRKWKKYEGRPCAHVLAAYWKSLATPLDEDAHPGAQDQQGSLFNMPKSQQPAPPPGSSPFAAPVAPSQGMQMTIPGMMPGQATGTPPGVSGAPPAPPSILPPYPMDPSQQQIVNPASVPGQKQPSPTNPMQYPGGTFSHVSDWEFDTMVHVSADLVNGQMVSTKHDDWGTYIGRSDDHGSGQPAKIPQGSIGEVLGTDPSTTMINVLFEDKMTEKMGELEPNAVVAWFLPSEVEHRPDVRAPGPAVRRR